MSRELPVFQTDVLVVGGGPGGFGAAMGAARLGVRVMLVERYGFLGGMNTAGLVNPFQYSNLDGKRITCGIFSEVVAELEKRGAGKHGELFGQPNFAFDVEQLALLEMEMVRQAGVALLLHSCATVIVTQGTTINGVVVENKSGMQRIFAKMFVDATGDADVSARCGVPTETGRFQDGLMQPMTLNFQLGGVNFSKMPSRDEINKIYTDEKKKGHIKNPRENVLWFETVRSDVIHMNTVRIQGVDGTDARDLTRAEVEGRDQMLEMINFLKKKISGFEKCYLLRVATQIGVRETRRIIGDFILSENDVLSGRRFPDVIARGSYPIDIHMPTGEGTKWVPLDPGVASDIPYRSIIPTRMHNLVIAGRPISVSHEAFSSTRVSPTCMIVGQAAGVAAALALKKKIPPKKLDVGELQRNLMEQGADLGI
ncbi:MAG: FAD-dependent oxidoreductase [bacterium]